MSTRTLATVIGFAMAVTVGGSAQSRSQAPSPSAVTALPDVVGIRPGISAQKGYDLLKKLAPQAQIGIGQYPVAGGTDKPVGETLALRHG